MTWLYSTWAGSFERGVKEIWCEFVKYIDVYSYRDVWQPFLNKVMNIQVFCDIMLFRLVNCYRRFGGAF